MSYAVLKIRGRYFKGRCSRHKLYNPAVDGQAGIKGGCPRCTMLLEIWECSLRLNGMIRKFDPKHDDLQRPPKPKEAVPEPDPRQLTFL